MTARAWIQSTLDHARGAQQQTLMSLQALDAAVANNLAHGAMAGDDPLTDSLRQQLECCAFEGGIDAAAYIIPSQDAELADAACDPWLYWVMAAGGVAGVLLSVLYPLGFAA